MACVITSHTNTEVENMVIKNTYLNVSRDETLGDLITRLDSFENKVKLVEIPNEKLRKGDYLSAKGVTKRYTLISNPEIVIPGRATDINKIAFVKLKGKEEAQKISEKPINQIKAEVGTKLHNISDQITLHLISKTSNLYTDKKPETSLEELRVESGLSLEDFNNLYKAVSEVVNLMNTTQKEIDPSRKAKVYTEKFILQLGDKTGAIGRTLDLLAIYSDKTASHFDYKFKSPTEQSKIKDPVTGKWSINKFDWLNKHDLEDFTRQIGTSAEVLKKQYGVKALRHNRVIPAHFELKFVNKQPTDKVTQLSIGASMNQYLTQIPIGVELTELISKEKTLTDLNNIKKNLQEQLDNTTIQEKKYILLDKIKKVDESIKLFQINNDISGVLSLYKSIAERYTDEIGNIKVRIREEEINGVINPDYIEDKDLVNLYQELGVIKQIIDNPEWYGDLIKGLSEGRIDNIQKLRGQLLARIGFMASNLMQEMVDRTLSQVEKAQLKDTIDLGMMEKWFQTFGQINHPIFIKAKALLDKANDETRLETQKFEKELREVTIELQKEQGKIGYNTFDILINKKTGNLHAIYRSEFWSIIDEAIATKDIEVLKKYLVLKPDALKRFEEQRERMKLRLTEGQFENWIKENPNVESQLTSKFHYIYYEVSKESSEFFSDGYKELSKNKAALAYYNFWVENMVKFKDYMDIEYSDRIPNNFIPWIKAQTVEQVLQGNYGTEEILKNLKDIFAVHEDTQTFGQVEGRKDLRTGDNLHQIPKWFINPLFDAQGNINIREKSYDLSKSMMIFASMAMNYNNMKQVEGTIMALKEVLATTTVIKTDNKSNVIGKILNPEIDALFTSMIDYHLYGVKLKGTKNRGFTEFMLKTKHLQQKIQLGLAPLTQIGSWSATTMSRWMESGKGYYFKDKQMINARKMLIGMVGDKNVALFTNQEKIDLARSLSAFFEPHQGKRGHLKGQGLSSNKLVGQWLENILFWGFRKGDELNENAVMLAMMQNYTIYDGKIKRIEHLPEGTKSLLELSSIKDGNLHIEGITNKGEVNMDLYTSFRNMVLNVNKGIKGSMNEEDMNSVNMNLLGNMVMSFRNWLPGLAEERFAGIKYNIGTKAITLGRWRSITTDLPSRQEAGMLRIVASALGRVGLVVAEGLTFNKLGIYKINEARTKELFEEFKDKNPNSPDIQDMSFEDFLDYKRGQIKAFAREAAMLLVLVGLVSLAAGADFDDDDEPDYKKYWASRQAFRLVNRTRRELMFFINPTEILNAGGSNVAPQIGLLTQSIAVLKNTWDETRDATLGENTNRDTTPPFYQSGKLIPASKMIFQFFEPTKQDEVKEF